MSLLNKNKTFIKKYLYIFLIIYFPFYPVPSIHHHTGSDIIFWRETNKTKH